MTCKGNKKEEPNGSNNQYPYPPYPIEVTVTVGVTVTEVVVGSIWFLSVFTKMPKIPAEGEFFSMDYVADHAFKDPDASQIF